MKANQIFHHGEYLDKYDILIWNEFCAAFENVKYVFYFMNKFTNSDKLKNRTQDNVNLMAM